MDVKHHWLLKTVCGCVAALVIGYVGQKLLGEEMFARATAKLYALPAGYHYGAGSADSIVVVLIDDQALEESGQSWPPSYKYYADLFRRLGHYQPRSVFLDVVLARERADPSIEKLSESISRLCDKRIPVYLAAMNVGGALRLRSGLEDGVADNRNCMQKVAVEYEPDQLDNIAWQYPQTIVENRAKSGTGLTAPPSAAVALYEAIRKTSLPLSSDSLSLVWGLSPASNGWHGSTLGNGTYCRGSFGWREWAGVLPSFLQWIVGRPVPADDPRPLCVFHETVRSNAFTAITEEDERRLRETIKGAHVLIGTALSYSNDFVISPLHGRVPGVYLHAMALDNLLTYGNTFKRVEGLELNADLPSKRSFWLVILGIVIVIWTGEAVERFNKRRENRPSVRWERQRPWRWLIDRAQSRPVLEIIRLYLLWLTLFAIGHGLFDIGLVQVFQYAGFAITAEWLNISDKLCSVVTDLYAVFVKWIKGKRYAEAT